MKVDQQWLKWTSLSCFGCEGKCFQRSPFSMILAASLSSTASVTVRQVPFDICAEFLSRMGIESYQMLSLHLLTWPNGFCSLFCWCDLWCLVICICWTTPTISFLGIHSKDTNTLSKRYLHHHVYCGTVHSSQNMEPTKVSVIKWVDKKMWHICIMEYYTAIKNEILSFLVKSKWRTPNWVKQMNRNIHSLKCGS